MSGKNNFNEHRFNNCGSNQLYSHSTNSNLLNRPPVSLNVNYQIPPPPPQPPLPVRSSQLQTDSSLQLTNNMNIHNPQLSYYPANSNSFNNEQFLPPGFQQHMFMQQNLPPPPPPSNHSFMISDASQNDNFLQFLPYDMIKNENHFSPIKEDDNVNEYWIKNWLKKIRKSQEKIMDEGSSKHISHSSSEFKVNYLPIFILLIYYLFVFNYVFGLISILCSVFLKY